jgi:carboxyl-terminal processing protease
MMLRTNHLTVLFLAGCLTATGTWRGITAEGVAHEAAKTNVANVVTRVRPDPNDGRIAWITAKLLADAHYLQHPFDDAISEKFFHRYLEALDPQHLHFLQSDLDEFDHYRTNLDDLTLTTNRVGDTTAAFEIFNRFIERLGQRVAYAEDLLQHDPFTFNTDERVLLNRHDAPYPRDLNEARDLWRQRLRYEYLQE